MMMNKDPEDKIFLMLSKEIQDAIARRDFHEAINIGIGAYTMFLGMQDVVSADGAMGLVMVALIEQSRMHSQNTEGECSFCGQATPADRLGAGPSAYICTNCVQTFHEIFFDNDGTKV